MLTRKVQVRSRIETNGPPRRQQRPDPLARLPGGNPVQELAGVVRVRSFAFAQAMKPSNICTKPTMARAWLYGPKSLTFPQGFGLVPRAAIKRRRANMNLKRTSIGSRRRPRLGGVAMTSETAELDLKHAILLRCRKRSRSRGTTSRNAGSSGRSRRAANHQAGRTRRRTASDAPSVPTVPSRALTVPAGVPRVPAGVSTTASASAAAPRTRDI